MHRQRCISEIAGLSGRGSNEDDRGILVRMKDIVSGCISDCSAIRSARSRREVFGVDGSNNRKHLLFGRGNHLSRPCRGILPPRIRRHSSNRSRPRFVSFSSTNDRPSLPDLCSVGTAVALGANGGCSSNAANGDD